MTTTYGSKSQALARGCYYAGVGKEALYGITHTPIQITGVLGEDPREAELYTLKNRDGADVTFAVSKFRSGFDLWIVADNGMMIRT